MSAWFHHPWVIRGAFAAGLATLIGVASATWLASRQRTAHCTDHLHIIYAALQESMAQTGTFPDLAFFPDDAQLDPQSLYAELAPFGVQPSHCLCPSAPESLRATGMSYIWNISLNGISVDELPEPAWMLVEVHALSTSVRPPHRGTYNLLLSDGTVKRSHVPPPMP